MKTALPFLLLACAAPLVAEDPQTVHFWKPSVAGGKQDFTFRVTMKSEVSMTTPDGAHQSPPRELHAEISATLTDVRVSAKGQPLEISIRIAKAEFTKNGEAAPLVAAGDEVRIVQAKPESTVEINGQPAPDEAARILRGLKELGDIDKPTFDEAFAPKDKVRAGDRWEVRAADAAKYFSQYGFEKIAPEAFSGHGTYLGTATHEGQTADSLSLEYEVSTTNFHAPGQAPEMKALSARYKVKGHSLVAPGEGPVTWGKIQAESDFTVEFERTIPGDVPFKGTSTTHVEREVEYRPAK